MPCLRLQAFLKKANLHEERWDGCITSPSLILVVLELSMFGEMSVSFCRQISALHESEQMSRCTAPGCPMHDKPSSSSGVFLHETDQLKSGETYLEAALRNWIMLQPRQTAQEVCQRCFPWSRSCLWPT